MFCEVAVSFRMLYKGLVSVNTINKDIVWAILYEAFREQYFEGIALFLYQPLWGGGLLIGIVGVAAHYIVDFLKNFSFIKLTQIVANNSMRSHFFKKSSLLLFEKWGVMCYIDVKLVILSANYEICKWLLTHLNW